MQTMQTSPFAAYCRWQECSKKGVVIIFCPLHFRELEFATHTASGPEDHCAHFQRRAASTTD
jgi:hypothetical protein